MEQRVSLDDVLAESDEREVKSREASEVFVTIPSAELTFWSLFSAGGMVAAFLLPVHVAILGILLAFGWLPDGALAYDRIIDIARFPLTRIYLGVVIVMPLFHWAHRFRFVVHHQLGVHGWKRLVATACYGTAIAGTVLTVLVLIKL